MPLTYYIKYIDIRICYNIVLLRDVFHIGLIIGLRPKAREIYNTDRLYEPVLPVYSQYNEFVILQYHGSILPVLSLNKEHDYYTCIVSWTFGQYEKHHVMILLLINQSNISLDFSLQLSKSLADSDLAVIGLIGIGPIRKISMSDQWK
jgi:hypothetical protein